MIRPQCYRVKDVPKRIGIRLERAQRMQDPRDPPVAEHMASVKAAVRDERLRDLERCWAERQLGAFDHLVKLWHKYDPDLYKYLSDEPRLRAVHILRKDGRI